MRQSRLTNEHRRESLSFSCVLVSAIFFVVLFQVPILKAPSVVTQVFRPLIIFFLLITMLRRGAISFPARTVAFIAAFHCCLVLLYNSMSVDEITGGVSVILYLLMFCAVTGMPWNKREVRFIIMACFLGAFVCAIALFLSNDPTDLHVGSSGDMKMLGVHVNRNKNAYAFATGTIIGVSYLLKGKKNFLVAIITAVLVYGLLYSQCRGAFFCTVLGVSILILGWLLDIKKKNEAKFLVYSILFVLFCIAAYYLLKNSELNRLIDGESKSGRDDGMKYAWNLFLNGDFFEIVFGHGFTFEENNTVGPISHLVYTQYLLSTGAIGTLLIVAMITLSGLKVRGSVSYALFANAILRTFFESLDYYIYIPLILSVIIYLYSSSHGTTANSLFRNNRTI